MVDRGPIYTERLFGAAMKKTVVQNLVSRTATFISDSVRCVCFLFFSWSGLFCVLVPGTLAFHLLYTLISCDCLVYFVSQSVTT